MTAGEETVQVFVLFESAITRAWVVERLSSDSSIRISGEGNNPLTALDDIRRLQPDVVLMHAHDRKKFGIDLPECIRSASSGSRIIMFTTGRHEHRGCETAGPDGNAFVCRFTDWGKAQRLLRDLRDVVPVPAHHSATRLVGT